MNKTVITSVAIVCVTVFGMFLLNTYKQIALKTLTEKRDRFTVCMQTAMKESRDSNKPIDAEEAKNICLNIDKA